MDFLSRFDTYMFAPAAVVKKYLSVGLGKKRIIFATPNIFAGVKFRSALAYNNMSGAYGFTAVFFNA